MQQEIVIALPKAIDDKLLERVTSNAAEQFGGYTIIEASGGWVSPNGEIIQEPVNLLTIVTEDLDDETITPKSWARGTARHVRKESSETSVLWFIRNIVAGGFE